MFERIRNFVIFVVGFTLPSAAFHVGSIGIFQITAFKAVTFVLLIFAVVELVITRNRIPWSSKAPWILLFLASYVVSSFMGLAWDIPFSAIFTRFTTFMSLVLYYFLITYTVRSIAHLRVLLWGFIVGGAVTLIPAAFGFEQGTEAHGGVRYEGWAGSANYLGYDLCVCLPVAMAYFFSARRLSGKLISAGFATTALFGILLALSRGAFVSMAGMWGLWVLRSGRIGSIRYLIPAVILVPVVVLIAPEDVKTRIQTMTDARERAEDNSIQSRLFVYQLALEAFASNPVVGVGNFSWYYWVAERGTGGREVGTVHNVYLEVATYQGLVGLIPFLMYLGITWREYNQARRAARVYLPRRDPVVMELGHLAMFLQIAYFGNLVGNLFSPALDSKSAWLVLSLGTVIVKLMDRRVAELEAEDPTEEQKDPWGLGYDYQPMAGDLYAR